MTKNFSEHWKKICPPLYQETDPKRLPQGALKKVMAWTRGPRGLLLYGDTGTGKTRAAWLLLKRLMGEGVRVVAFTGSGFRDFINSRYIDHDAYWWIEEFSARSDLLFLDDLDKIRFTLAAQSQIFQVIEGRIANKLPTIITTNAVGKTLEGSLPSIGRPLVRRLREFCDIVNFGKAKGK